MIAGSAHEHLDGQKLRINPVTRVDGRSDIEVLFAPEGTVSGARFRALEVRGLEFLAEGVPAARAPQILSRTCGACGTFHQLASCMALEDAAGCVVPESAAAFRELLSWLSYGTDHLLSVAYHELPDYALPMSDAAVKNITGLYVVEQEAVSSISRALQAFGSAARELAGRPVHPSVIVPGGVASLPDERTVERAAETLKAVESDVRETIRLAEMLLKRDANVMDSLALEGFVGALTRSGDPGPLGDTVTVKPFSSDERTEMEVEKFYSTIVKEPVPWSYVVPVSAADARPLLVGPLARLNLGFAPSTPLAKIESDRAAEQWGKVLDSSLFSFMALVIEVARAWERSISLLESGQFAGEASTPVEFSAGSGLAMVDSPRGLILHAVRVGKNSTVAGYEMITPLQFNHEMMNVALSRLASEVVEGLELSDTAGGRLEFLIRSFNPCVPCGTHEQEYKGCPSCPT